MGPARRGRHRRQPSQFLNRATVSLTGAGLTTFAAAGFVAFLWPTAKGGFGGKINVGKIDDVIASIQSSGGFFYNATARSWVTAVPGRCAPEGQGRGQLQAAARRDANGIVVLYQKCPHLGCRVPQCVSSQWFECPCHGSQYNRVGEKKGGPAPRGMDRFAVHGRAAPATSSSTPARCFPARRSVPTPPAKRLRVRTASVAEVATDDRLGDHGNCLGHPRRQPCIGWVVYYFANRNAARPELGSEIELAPNRRPYYDDETLEGSRLTRVNLIGVLLLVTMVIGLPLYWVLEPGRQAGAVSAKEETFVEWGGDLFETTANGGFNCAGCHGGMKAIGGQAPTAVTDPKTGEVQRGQLVRAGAEHRAVSLHRRRGAVHPQLRSHVLADVGVGHHRRRPDERPTDRDDHRLPPQHPAAAGELPHRARVPAGLRVDRPHQVEGLRRRHRCPTTSGPRSTSRRRSAAQKLVDEGKYPTVDDGHGRGAVQPRHQQRCIQLRPLPHRGLELRQSPRCAGPGRVRLEPHRLARRTPTSRASRT